MTHPPSILTRLVVLGIVLAPPSPLRGDLLYFKGGGRAQVAARVEGDSVIVDAPMGKLAFLRSDFLKLVPGFDPRGAWPARREAVRDAPAEAQFREAWWALENGLPREAVALLRDLHVGHPDHQPTARMIAAYDRLCVPIEDPDLSSLTPALAQVGRPHRTAHLLLYHEGPPEEVAERAEMLEDVVSAYQLILTGWGLDLKPPAHRLPSIYLKSRANYLELLGQQGSAAFATTRGYYHPTLRVVFAYDTRGDEAQARSRSRIAAVQRQVDGFETMLSRVPESGRVLIEATGADGSRRVTKAEAGRVLDDKVRDLRRLRMLADLDWRAIDLGIAAHETIHQLAVETGLVRRFDDLPTWLHEGLAAQFEVVRGGRWAGFRRAHDLRLPDARKLSPPPPLEPLVRGRGFGPGYDRDRYAAAWSLVDFLANEAPVGFVSFLEILRTSPPKLADDRGDRAWNAFKLSLTAPTSDLQRDWHRHLNDRRTPLEEEAPPP
ncbi:DUF1570 domain-containing protein [Isosphaeraceae bacterium EP7]